MSKQMSLYYRLNKSLWMFSEENCVRATLKKICLSQRFDYLILFFILLSSI